MNAEFKDAIAHRRRVAEVTQLRRTDASKNARFPDRISERFQPLIELRGAKEDAREAMYPFGYSASSADAAFVSLTLAYAADTPSKMQMRSGASIA